METASSANNVFGKERVKCAKFLIWTGFIMYVFMMGTKNVFTAEMITLMDVFETTKAQTSLAMTYYFITYAIAQIVLTFIMQKLNLRIYLTVTGALSAIVTILMGLSKTIESLYVLCAFNGIFSAGIYSGCMAAFSKYLPVNLLPYANRIMYTGTAVYSVLSYGVPPLFIGHGLWNAPFILLGGLFLLSVIIFFIAFNKMKKFPQAIPDTKTNAPSNDEKPYFRLKNKKSILVYFAIMLSFSLLANVMYYMVLNWIPSMLHDVFSLPQSYSILITLIVPVLSAFGSIAAVNLCQKYTNIFNVGAIFRLIGLIALVPMIFFFDKNIVLSVILLSLFVSFCSGSSTVFTGVLAFKMRTQVNSGSYLAAFNAVASIAAGVVPPLTGKLIDSFSGVSGYGISYSIACLICTVLVTCILIYSAWFNKSKKRA